MYRLRLPILILICLLSLSSVFAQAPDNRNQARDAALNKMSQRLGQTVSTTSLSSQQWRFGSYAFVGSDCVGAPVAAPVAGGWQRFEFVYQGTNFVYLVADNLQSVILCNEDAMPSVNATAIPATPAPQGFVSPTPQGFIPTATQVFEALPTATRCPLPTRLERLDVGIVTPGDPNWVHAEPRRSSAKIGEIPGEEFFNVIGDPICDEVSGMNFYLVSYNGLEGYTSEGLNGEYWLEEYIVSPEGYSYRFTFEMLQGLTIPQWSKLTMPQGTVVAISNTANQIAISYGDEDAVQLFSTTDPTNVRSIPKRQDDTVTAMSFAMDSDQLIIGYASGVAETLDFRQGTVLQASGIVTAVAMFSDFIFVADSSGLMSVYSLADDRGTPIRTFQLTEPAGRLEFSPDGSTLLIYSTQGTLIQILQAPN